MIDHLAFGFMSFAMRTRHDPSARSRACGRRSPAPIRTLGSTRSCQWTASSRARWPDNAFSIHALGVCVVAAVLAAIGIYGVLAYVTVNERRKSVYGWRSARATGMFPSHAGPWTVVCSARDCVRTRRSGSAHALFAGRALRGHAARRRTFMIVAVAFAAVAALASYLPARRAAQVDPMVALRNE